VCVCKAVSVCVSVSVRLFAWVSVGVSVRVSVGVSVGLSVRVSVCELVRSGDREQPLAGGGHGLGACGVAAVRAATLGAGGAALAGRSVLWVWVGGVFASLCVRDRGSEELCLGGPGLRGGWRHQRASHAEATGLAGAAGAELSRAVTSAGLSVASAWKW